MAGVINKSKLLEKFYKKDFKSLVKKVNRQPLLTPDDAEDIVQTAFSKANQYLDSFNPKGNVGAWFNTILNNTITDYFNDVKSSPFNYPDGEEVLEFDEELFDTEEESVGFNQKMVEHIENEINLKSEPLRTILHMYFIQNHPPKDISQAVEGVSNHSIRTYIHSFKTEMRELG